MGYAPEGSEIFPELTVAENMMISRWMSAKARRRLETLADGNIEERVYAVFPEVRELLRAIACGMALEDANVMKALRG
jgi:branched-chain amino acid transport system ATP-binding protein